MKILKLSIKPALMNESKPSLSSFVKPFLPTLGFGLARSSSVWATFKSPQNTTGFVFSKSLKYSRNALSHCSCLSLSLERSSLALGVYTVTKIHKEILGSDHCPVSIELDI